MMNKRDYDSDVSDTSCEEESFARRNLKATNGTKKRDSLTSRPNASDGYWLCTLLPFCLATHYFHIGDFESESCYDWSTIAALGMCIQSLCFFIFLNLDAALVLKLLLSLIPGFCTSFMYNTLMDQSWLFALVFGFFVTFSYQNVYIKVMKGFPRCFSFGEAAILVQGLMLFIYNAMWTLPQVFFKNVSLDSDFDLLKVIMMSALTCLLMVCVLFTKFKFLRSPEGFYGTLAALLIAVTCLPVTSPIPVIALYQFVTKEQRRIFIIGFYLALVGLTVITVWWQLRNSFKASTRVRKLFHVLILLVYIPGLLYECNFLFISSGVALAIFTVLELMRIMDIPPISLYLKNAFASFSDEKDAGMLALTPFCLLIGCSIPLWLNPYPCNESDDGILPKLAGILSVGIGDTAASVIGSRVGRTKWRNTSRSLEGTISFVCSVLISVVIMFLLGYIPMTQAKWFVVIAATINTALVEAFTDQIDNLVLPLVFYGLINLA